MPQEEEEKKLAQVKETSFLITCEWIAANDTCISELEIICV